ncbi:MAG: hypothetical protein ABC537_00740 [Candidatus Methanosuratincola sp.]
MSRRSIVKRKGVIPILAVAVMVSIAFLTTGIFAVELKKVVHSQVPEDLIIQDSMLMKHYGYASFKVTIKSNTDRELVLSVSVIGEDGLPAISLSGVRLSPRGETTIKHSGFFGHKFFVGNGYAIMVYGGSDIGTSGIVECKGVEFSRNKLILLDIDGFSAFIGNNGVQNSSAIIAGAEDAAVNLGIPYEKVTTISRWESILASPIDGAVVINPYGDVTPVSAWGVENKEEFLRNLRYIVGNHSWTWVHVGGVPFSILSDGARKVSLKSNEGIELFFNSNHVTISSSNAPMELVDFVLTDIDGNSLNYFLMVTNFRTLPEEMRFDHPIVLPPSELPQTKFVFYQKRDGDSQTAARSFCIGSGYYVHWGGPSNLLSEYETGALSLMLALYTNLR